MRHADSGKKTEYASACFKNSDSPFINKGTIFFVSILLKAENTTIETDAITRIRNIVAPRARAPIFKSDKKVETITTATTRKVIVFSGKISELTNRSSLAIVLKSKTKTNITYENANVFENILLFFCVASKRLSPDDLL